ncbi:MAG TPA: S41 family peptidase [Acetomicrobium flavidum]|mgnify:FL=1|uniref:C-terminal processing peptidase n=1 Tax=Acetomicrobium mobile (strain ATCC BAA-54 / DSM 13181 / JCM 12221 / NGA) TaxID=891968 RepID=I4BVA6_ACEMN|nr:S41 family peptidase [Acetomicrobium mobile]AFM21213.1 C-terminal processing peptidase [Acetomicrobium mobile DSM 13181]HOP88206.1 S41 family peptidase [Acetomicrobium flavidum]
MKKLTDKNKRFIFGLIAIIALIGGWFMADGTGSEIQLKDILPFETQYVWMMKQARTILETYHVNGDKDKKSDEELFYGAMKGMVAAWGDPYSRFVDPNELKQEEIDIEGEYGGLGLYIGSRDGKILVVSPIEGTPADKAGLQPMDEIVKVDDDVVLGWNINDVVEKLRGKPGTNVTVWVRREGHDELLRFDMTRELIKIDSVNQKRLTNDVAYIRITHFTQKTAEEMQRALNTALETKAKGLVLDLRNNPGGLLDASVAVADYFLDGGEVVSIKGRVEKANEVYEAKPGVLFAGPVSVLINEGSASASEIVAGALKDRNRAVLVGEKSFGKGSVQTLFKLPDGSGLFVTIAKYYTPSGVTIDGVGIKPDIEVKGKYTGDLKDDAQLQRALKEVEGLLAKASDK